METKLKINLLKTKINKWIEDEIVTGTSTKEAEKWVRILDKLDQIERRNEKKS